MRQERFPQPRAAVFRGWRLRATARMEASVEVPSIGFRWMSDPPETSKTAFVVIGEESNGRYFTP